MSGTCRLNNEEPEKGLRYVIEHIQKGLENWMLYSATEH
ncbi:transposase domain-containing protein [Salmonella enterica]|nr:transposase domain-containing protein [Salmonella enterica]EBK3136334.1 transposase domain-containing protein [Salmonella enterica]